MTCVTQNKAAGLRIRRPAAATRRMPRDYIFTPFSVKYFVAPGCHGIGEFFGA